MSYDFTTYFKRHVETMVALHNKYLATEVRLLKQETLLHLFDQYTFDFLLNTEKEEQDFDATVTLSDLNRVAKEIKKGTILKITKEDDLVIFSLGNGVQYKVKDLKKTFDRPLGDITQFQENLWICEDGVEFKEFLKAVEPLLHKDYTRWARMVILDIYPDHFTARVYNGGYVIERTFKGTYEGPKDFSKVYLTKHTIPGIIGMLENGMGSGRMYFNEGQDETQWYFGWGTANVLQEEEKFVEPDLGKVENGLKYAYTLDTDLGNLQKLLKKEVKDQRTYVRLEKDQLKFHNAKGYEKTVGIQVHFYGEPEETQGDFTGHILQKFLGCFKGEKLSFNFFKISELEKQSTTVKVFVDEVFVGYLAMVNRPEIYE